MKSSTWILVVFTILAVISSGCKKSSGPQVDTAPVEKSFSSADPTLKTSADKAVSALKAGDYTAGLAELKDLATNAKLTPEQRQAVQDVIVQVQKAIADAGVKAQGEAGKAINDLQKSLPK